MSHIKPMILAPLLEYKDFFSNNVHKPIREYVRMLGRHYVMTVCSSLLNDRENRLLERQSDIESFLVEFFGINNSKFNSLIVCGIQIKKQFLKQKGLSGAAFLFHETQMLYLMSESYDESVTEYGQLKGEDVQMMVFFEACLAVNTEYIQRQSIVSLQLGHMNAECARIYGMMCVHIAYGDYSAAVYEEVLLAQLFKSMYLFEFLEKNDPDLLSLFLDANQINRWEDYVLELFHIGTIVGETKNSNIHIISDGKGNVNALRIFNKISEVVSPNANDWDFVLLRNSPFYKTPDGDYKILSRIFFAEKLYKSLYFELSALNEKRKGNATYRTNFRCFFTTDFSEHFLFYKVIDESFPKAYKRKSGEEFKRDGLKEKEPDYYVRNGNKLFLWESKDNLFNADIKTSFDFDKIEAFVKDRLYKSVRKNNTIEARAVLQLVRSTEAAYEGHLLDKYKERKMRVYPILITYDRSFQTPGMNVLINNWFRTELENNSVLLSYINQISSLIVMDIDTLILCRTKFCSRDLRIEDMLTKYAKDVLNAKGLEQYPSFDDFFHKEMFSGGVQVKKLMGDLSILLKDDKRCE